jgi:sulfide:quinone oxidoreductase
MSNSGNGSRRAVVVGSSFAGLTAAFELRKHLDPVHEVVVIEPRDHFTFIPSLIWVPFGMRDPEDVTFDLEPVYSKKGIGFINEWATGFDLDGRKVMTSGGQEVSYDSLLVATGPRLAFEKIDGLGPEGGFTQSVCNLEHAMITRDAWEEFLEKPGPVVVGTAQGGSCFGASYEFLLNAHHRIRKAGLEKEAPMTFITAEPFLGHFGLGGVSDSQKRVEKYFDKLGIEGIANNVIKEVRDGEIELKDGRTLPFALSMIVPPFTGVDAVMGTEGLGNPMGFIPVNDEFRHAEVENVYAAGVDVAVAPPQKTEVPAGVPKTGQMSEVMAKVAAQNMAADIQGGERREMPMSEMEAICILDAGNQGIIFKADHVLGESEHPHVMAGPQAHWAKIAFEKVFMGSRKRGHPIL